MAILTKEELINKFQTGDKPTQQDFQDLLESLVGKTEPVASNAWQPPNSPVYMAQGQELTCTHPSITNENYSLSISQEIAGASGQTNISIDFAQAAESNYTQEDATYSSDFRDGKVTLHMTLGAEVDVSRMATTTVPFTSSASSCSYSYGTNTTDPFYDGSSIPGNNHSWDTSGGTTNWLKISLSRAIKLTRASVYTEYWGGTGQVWLQGSNDDTSWVTLHTIENVTGYSTYQQPIVNQDYYKYYRWYIPSGVYAQLGQLHFYHIEETFNLNSTTITTNDNSHFSLAQASKIESLTIASSKPVDTDLKCAVSFDGRLTWKRWDGAAWVNCSDVKINGNSITEVQNGFINLITESLQFIDLSFNL